jgi:hypothetical protein
MLFEIQQQASCCKSGPAINFPTAHADLHAHQREFKHRLKTIRKFFCGGLPVDLAAGAAARHLLQEGLKQGERENAAHASAHWPT